MGSFGLPYELIVVSVNSTPNAEELRHAEDDGQAYAAVRVSGLGPASPERTQLLLGASATPAAIDAAFAAATRRRPQFLEFAFDGHGNEEGLGVARGSYSFVRLEDRLNAVDASRSLVTLNSCHAGAFAKHATPYIVGLEGVPAAWCAGLFATVPGTRALMASSSEGLTKEVGGFGSVFRKTLVTAMFDRGPGDLLFDEIEFASDLLVLRRAVPLMARFGVYPTYVGPDDFMSDFPMVVSNRQRLGHVAMRILPGPGVSAHAEVVIRGRRHLPTTIAITPIDSYHHTLPTRYREIVPNSDDMSTNELYLPDLRGSAGCLDQLGAYGRCRVTWRVSVIDHNHMMIASTTRVLDHSFGMSFQYASQRNL